ncbi:MAG: hypothetical protein LC798_12865 [Chloroflexi bacterium]|nr:hypothetical protein [Chloroflexota bacterium]
MFDQIESAAKQQNGWELIGAIRTHPGGNGYVPHGVALVKRDHSPFGGGREFATAGWYVRADGSAGFESGHYDLTLADALADFNERVERAGMQGGGE